MRRSLGNKYGFRFRFWCWNAPFLPMIAPFLPVIAPSLPVQNFHCAVFVELRHVFYIAPFLWTCAWFFCRLGMRPKFWIHESLGIYIWLVVDLPIWKIMEWKSVGMMTFPIYGKMFRTTIQIYTTRLEIGQMNTAQGICKESKIKIPNQSLIRLPTLKRKCQKRNSVFLHVLESIMKSWLYPLHLILQGSIFALFADLLLTTGQHSQIQHTLW